jgi:FHS family L-fucose permease-like MFS transporter
MLWTICSIYLLSGGTYALLQAVLPTIQAIWGLSYGQVMAVEVVYFGTLVTAAVVLPRWLQRVPYPRDLGVAALIAGLGALCVAMTHWVFLLVGCGLLGIGSAGVQIVGNASLAQVSPREHRASRLTLSQAFAALGMVVAPLSTGLAIKVTHAPQMALQGLFVALASLWALAALLSLRGKRIMLPSLSTNAWRSGRAWRALLVLGCYVGAEVGVASLLVPFLQERDIGSAVALSGIYWLGLMIGRFASAGYVRRLGTSRALIIHSIAAVACLALAWTGSAVALLATGLCNSVMFSAIWSLAIDQTEDSSKGLAGFLLLASLGGAIFPLAEGLTADRFGLMMAFFWPLGCYLAILLYAMRPLPKNLKAPE